MLSISIVSSSGMSCSFGFRVSSSSEANGRQPPALPCVWVQTNVHLSLVSAPRVAPARAASNSRQTKCARLEFGKRAVKVPLQCIAAMPVAACDEVVEAEYPDHDPDDVRNACQVDLHSFVQGAVSALSQQDGAISAPNDRTLSGRLLVAANKLYGGVCFSTGEGASPLPTPDLPETQT